jgi:hypothetical protein
MSLLKFHFIFHKLGVSEEQISILIIIWGWSGSWFGYKFFWVFNKKNLFCIWCWAVRACVFLGFISGLRSRPSFLLPQFFFVASFSARLDCTGSQLPVGLVFPVVKIRFRHGCFFSCSKLSVPPGARADFSFSLCAGSSCSRSSDARSIRSCRPKFSAPGPFLVAARFPALLARRVSRRRYSFVARGFVSARLEPRRAPLLISPSCSCSLLVDASGLAAGAA